MSVEKPSPLDDKKKCVECGGEILNVARVCPICKERQSSWQNYLKFWASVAGLITLVASGTAFTFGLVKSQVNLYFPPAVAVSELDTFGRTVFINQSNQDTLIDTIILRSSEPQRNLLLRVDQVIKPRTVAVVNLIQLSKEQFRGIFQTIYGNKQGEYSKKLDNKLVSEIKRNIDSHLYAVSFLLLNGQEYSQILSEFGDQLTLVACDIEISYIYLDSGIKSKAKPPCAGVIKHVIPSH